MNDELTPKQRRQIREYSKKARAGKATSWRPKAHYSHTPEESAEFMRKMLEEYKAKLRREAKSGDEADEE